MEEEGFNIQELPQARPNLTTVFQNNLGASETDWLAGRQTDRQTDRLAGPQTDWHRERLADGVGRGSQK